MKTNSFLELLHKKMPTFCPVLGEHSGLANWVRLDLSIKNKALQTALLPGFSSLKDYKTALEDFIIRYIAEEGLAEEINIGVGGYGEHRNLYERSPYFKKNDNQQRCIHLGMDLWLEEGSPIFMPLDGHIHSFQFNQNPLDYGGTIITKHEVEGIPFFLLFGHLSKSSLFFLKEGNPVNKGEVIALLGNPKENGGWPPHLHFQIILDLEGNWGDYPGVATQQDAKAYLKNCPDPTPFIIGSVDKISWL